MFRISTNGSFASLYSFHGSDGQNPVAGLAYGIDTNFYGTDPARQGRTTMALSFVLVRRARRLRCIQFGGFAADSKFPQSWAGCGH